MPNFGEFGQQEAGEFLIYLLTIFNINCKAKKEEMKITLQISLKNIEKKI